MGFGISLVLAVPASLAMFLLMHWLVRPPSARTGAAQAPSVLWLAAPPLRRSHPRSRTRVPAPPRTHRQSPSRVSAPHRAPARLPRVPLALAPHGATSIPALALPGPVRRRARPLEWRRALDAYLHRREQARAAFRAPRLPPRPATLQALPERMRLPFGGTLDRIGTHCYVTPGRLAFGAEAGGNPTAARVMQVMLPLFAHEVPCVPGERVSPGQDFLDRLHRLVPQAPAPATR